MTAHPYRAFPPPGTSQAAGREIAGRFGDPERGVHEEGDPGRCYEDELTTHYVPTLEHTQYLIDGTS